MAEAASQKAKKTKKGRKQGRNALACQRYKLEQHREKNKIKRLRVHMRLPKHMHDNKIMELIVARLALKLQASNPNFDSFKFRAACRNVKP